MSKYTTEVRYICEKAAGLQESAGYSSVNEVIGRAIPSVFSFDFPIFDEAYRNVICGKILKHYFTREICEETVGLWKLRIDTRLNEVMPYYNKLYKSELLEFNPLYDVDITRSGNRDNTASNKEDYTSNRDVTGNSVTDTENSGTNKTTVAETYEGTNDVTRNSTTSDTSSDKSTGTNTSTSTGSGESTNTITKDITREERDLYSDTPQGALTNVENAEYLTNARKKTGSESDSENGRTTNSTQSSSNGTNETSAESESEVITIASDVGETTGKRDSVTDGTASATGKSTTTSDNNDKFTSEQNKNATSTEEYLERVIGKQGGGSYSKMLMEYRDTFLNIDMMVIDSLSDLFFGLW